MIYRERVGDAMVEYEGSPQEIFEYFELVRSMAASKVEGMIESIFNKYSPTPEEYQESDVSVNDTFKEGNIVEVGKLYYVYDNEHCGAFKCIEKRGNGYYEFVDEQGHRYQYRADEVYPITVN